FTSSTNGLYVKAIAGGPSQLWYFDLSGKPRRKVEFKEPVTVQEMLVRRGEDLTFRSVSFTQPSSWQYYFPDSNRVFRSGLFARSPVEYDDIEVGREFAVSKDGTKVPLSIRRKKGTKLDGNNPTILYGYGGYGISLTPNFSLSRRIWFDAGGVYAIANLRGGGEFGEAWHKAGNLTKKQNVFDDFIACAEHLIRSNYTNPKTLAIERGSNGGLLMGAALATGENDGRVNPYNSLKMAARLQAATRSKRPVLLRTSASAGHGMGSSLRDKVAEEADVWTFLIDQLGASIEPWFSGSPVERGPWSGAVTPASAVVKAKLRDPGARA